MYLLYLFNFYYHYCSNCSIHIFISSLSIIIKNDLTYRNFEGLELKRISIELHSVYYGMIGRFRSSWQTGPLGHQVCSIRFFGSRVRIVSNRFVHKIVLRCAPERELVLISHTAFSRN